MTLRHTNAVAPIGISDPSTCHSLKLTVTQLKGLVGLMPEPIRLTYIKPSFLRNRQSRIKVCSTLELLLKPCIIIELGKQGCELFSDIP